METKCYLFSHPLQTNMAGHLLYPFLSHEPEAMSLEPSVYLISCQWTHV